MTLVIRNLDADFLAEGDIVDVDSDVVVEWISSLRGAVGVCGGGARRGRVCGDCGDVGGILEEGAFEGVLVMPP